MEESLDVNSNRPSEVRVVSFDLDNTLWKTGPTIQGANDALAEYLDEQQIVQTERVEKVMGNLFQVAKSTYSPLSGDDPKSPVMLTQLRKDAIRFILEENNGYSEQEATEFAEKSFQVWTNARHDALPKNFATSVISCLEEIRQIQSTSGQPVLIGAITDGNSDPRTVPMLSEFFDFVVNAEGVGVAKPDRRVYMAAIKEVAQHPYVADIFEGVDLENEDLVEDLVGPWWIHIGDDFLKDIVAAKDMGMRTIWAQELVKKPEVEPTKKPSKSTEEFVKEISAKLADKNVVEMSVGSDDYLVGSIHDEFTDAIVPLFDRVGKTLVAWQEEAAMTSRDAEGDPVKATFSPPATTPQTGSAEEGENKFCMSCGTKLPPSATFCSSCGAKQPELG